MDSQLAEKSGDLALLRDFAQRGDRAALGALFSRHADAAYRFALRLCGRPADAEDVLQTAFLQVFRNAAQFRGGSSVKSWILGFVLNASRSRAREESRRRARQERAAAGAEPSVFASPVDPEEADRVREALEELPEHYRSPVWLHYGEGLSPGEVASVLNLPSETVRKQISRGIDRLREALLPYGAATGVVATLASLAVETAPPTIGAAGAVPAASAVIKAGIGSKIAATAVAAIALASTAGFLGWGLKSDDGRPPEIAEIERVVREWQPTPEERRFDEIGWAPDLREALRLSKASGRPVLLLTQSGRINLGRSDGGSQFLRSRALSDSRTISLLNGCFVPVYRSNADFEDSGTGSIEERKRLNAVRAEAREAKLPAGMDCLFLLDPDNGRVCDTFDLGKATGEAMTAWLESHRKTPAGPVLVTPSSQSMPPLAPVDSLVLHLTSRYLDAEGRVEEKRTDFHEVPGEDWTWLSPREWRTLVPPAGQSAEVDPAIARRLLTHFHPSDMSIGMDPNRRNRLEVAVLRATRYSSTFVRIDGRLRMSRSFTQVEKTPELPVIASLKGYLELDPDGTRIRSLRIITEHASYGKQPFGVAVRSVP